MMFLPMLRQRSPRMDPGWDWSGLVAPMTRRPPKMTSWPSQTMQTMGPGGTVRREGKEKRKKKKKNTRRKVLNEGGEEFLASKISIVTSSLLGGGVGHLHGNKFVTLSLKALDDLTDESTLDTIGLDGNEGSLFVGPRDSMGGGGAASSAQTGFWISVMLMRKNENENKIKKEPKKPKKTKQKKTKQNKKQNKNKTKKQKKTKQKTKNMKIERVIP